MASLTPPAISAPIAGPSPLPGSILPTSSPVAASLTFGPVTGVMTCTAATISWSTTGTLSNMTLWLVNPDDVSIPTSSTPNQQSANLFSMRIVDGIDPASGSYLWSPVNGPPGSYLIYGDATGLTIPAFSPEFFIAAGDDETCLDGPPYFPFPVSTPTASPAATAASAVGTTSKKHTAGAIAGGVIGGIAFVIALLGAFLIYRRYNTAARTRRRTAAFRGRNAWLDLGSKESGIHNTQGGVSNGKPGKGHFTTNSASGMLPTKNRSSFDYGASRMSPIGSELDDATTLADEEKHEDMFQRGASDDFDTIGPLHYDNRRSSLNMPPPLSSLPSTPTRAAVRSPTQPSARPPSYRTNRHSLDGRALSGSVDLTNSPTSPAEMIPMGRSGSGNARRSARKPVPAYDDGLARSDSVRSGTDTYLNTNASEGGTSGHNSPMTRSVEDLRAALNHKSSFGNKPMHVLIPDMPPPQKD
ncbi:hypothetical protein ABKN59_008730 [Abortiporus biennis]